MPRTPSGGPSAPPPAGYSSQDAFERTSAPTGNASAKDPYVYGPTYDMVKAGQGPGWAKGLRGPGVEKMQGLLRGAGYPVPQNGGRFDAATDGAVRNFQRDQKLPITGRVDRTTLNALEGAQPGAKKADGADGANGANGADGANGANAADAPAPTRPKTTYDVYRQWTSIYDSATKALESGRVVKGQDPEKDKFIQEVIDNSPPTIIMNDPDHVYGGMVEAQQRFFAAARNAGYLPQRT
jgi:peptidoglycan hydrolase-like protein with peptidoglycan-binding domain